MTDARAPIGGGAIDWDALRARLKSLAHAVGGGSRTAEDAVGVLEARARELRRPRVTSDATGGIEAVMFEREGEWYAIESRHVRAVSRVDRPSRLPGVGASVAGVVAWRGQMLALIDLATRGLGSGFMLVLEQSPPSLGLLADVVGEVTQIADADLLAVPEGLARRGTVRWVTPGAVLVLDGAALIETHTEEDT